MIATRQDFSLVNTYVESIMHDLSLKSHSNAFYFVILDLILGLQEDEIKDAITDNYYLSSTRSDKGHDRGIDALYIENVNDEIIIHLFNCKYTHQFEKINNHFPSAEIDKIINFIHELLMSDDSICTTVNPILSDKIKEIFNIFNNHSPKFVIHLCANLAKGLEHQEKERFERSILRPNFTIEYHLIDNLVELLANKHREVVNARIKAIDKNFFEKSDGDIRALVVNVDVKDLLRIVLNSEAIRNKVDMEDYNEIKRQGLSINENVFEDNVRVYLKQRSRINRNIKQTALSKDNHRFFYFNNGITITCDSFSYVKSMRSPIIDLENIQIVNGSQTIHALYEAFLEDSNYFDDISILCRIYETKNTELSTQIAEYTNSQNPVKSRDIRSIDLIQLKLEKEFLARGFYYERKKGFYTKKPRNRVIDAEKVGQVLLAFANEMPAEAKNKKSIIFSEKYDEIFNDDINADQVLLAYRLFEFIEGEKATQKKIIEQNEYGYESAIFIVHASYYILYILGKIARKNQIPIQMESLETIWSFYSEAYTILKQITEEQSTIPPAVLFKGNKIKNAIEQRLGF